MKSLLLSVFCLILLMFFAFSVNCKSKRKDFVDFGNIVLVENKVDYKEVKRDTTPGGRPIYLVVEQMPQFPGGEVEMMKFLSKNIIYPKVSEAEEGYLFLGRLIARFYIDIDGSVQNVRILRSMHPAVDSMFVRVLESMPKWEPGKQNGENVPVYYTFPLHISPRR